MERFSLRSFTSCSKKICIVGVSGICGRRQEIFFDFVISSWGKQWEIFLVAIGECCLYRLLTAKTRNVRGLSQQSAFMGCRLSTSVSPVHLVDELVLVFYIAFCWCSFFGGCGEQVSMVLVSWELMLFLFIYLLFHYFIIYLFILGKRSIYNEI